MIIHLLPVSHDVQLGHHGLSKNLKVFLKKTIKSLNIDLIYEEMSIDDVKSAVHEYLALNLARELKVDYIFCDPSDEERGRLGLLSPKEICNKMYLLKKEAKISGKYPKESFLKFKQEMTDYNLKRENYWLTNIEKRNNKSILFILGVGHLSFHRNVHGEGFDKLLKSKGYNTQILTTDFINRRYL